MPDLLRRAGLRVECLSDVFADDMTPDPVWIAHCSRNDLIAITGDKAIETDPINRQAAIDSQLKVLFLDENNSRAVEWASAVIVSRQRLVDVILENDGPLFVSVKKNCGSLVWKVRKP